MTPNQMADDLQRKTQQLQRYAADEFPKQAGRKALRFIDGNFRAQGWQGKQFEHWKPNKRKGTILVKTGKLRRSSHAQTGTGQVRIYSDSPYAAVHNRGFKGTVQVKEHQRRKYTKGKIATGRFRNGKEYTRPVSNLAGTTTVKTHTRKINIPRRQFMPETYDDSPVLMNSIKRDIVKQLKNIFQ